jgi:tetratricopeptide (TPR) repeat protein
MKPIFAWCLALGSAAALVAVAALRAEDATRMRMDGIFDTLTFLLPLSLSDERFQDPASRDAILLALRQLEENGAKLASHGTEKDASFTFLSRSLARDSADIRQRYASGRIAEARFLLHQLTENCVACHSRLPSDREFPLGQRFVDQASIAELPLEERVSLEMATRQFDRALATYEELLASPETSPTDLDLLGHIDGYLELCIRIRQDPARAARTLERFAARPDLTPSLRTHVDHWIASLHTLEKRHLGGSDIGQAHSLLREAEDSAHFGDARGALVYYIAASSVLHRFVAARPRPAGELAEAYYWLGVIESRVGRTFWLSETEFFLEAAIRLDPSAPFAERAYDLLEEFVVSGYTGSSGVHVPADAQERLRALRELIDRS